MKKILILLLFIFTLVGCELTPPTKTDVKTNSTKPTDTQTEVTPTKLEPPQISIDESGIASFKVENASSYIYILNNGDEVSTTNHTLELREGDSLKVKAIGDKTNYTDSEWSQVVTYHIKYPTNPDEGYTEFPWI